MDNIQIKVNNILEPKLVEIVSLLWHVFYTHFNYSLCSARYQEIQLLHRTPQAPISKSNEEFSLSTETFIIFPKSSFICNDNYILLREIWKWGV